MNAAAHVDAVVLMQQEMLADGFKEKLVETAKAGWNYYIFSTAVLEDASMLAWAASQLHLTATELLGSSRFKIVANVCDEGCEMGIAWGVTWPSILIMDDEDDTTDEIQKMFGSLPTCTISDTDASDIYDSLIASNTSTFVETEVNKILNANIIELISAAKMQPGCNVQCIAPWPYDASNTTETRYLMNKLDGVTDAQPILIEMPEMCYIGLCHRSFLVINVDI